MLRTIAFAICLLLAALPARAGGYADYAQGVTANLPEGAAFRPDLEEYLSARASAYRVKKRRRPLLASGQLQEAARAQAVDIMILGRSGHRSRKGHGFTVRFKAFQEDPSLFYTSGENAASDRRRGEANRAKADRLFQLWLDSTGHRKNMLVDEFAYVSTGVVQRGSELWAVQIFWGEPKKTNFFFSQ